VVENYPGGNVFLWSLWFKRQQMSTGHKQQIMGTTIIFKLS